MKSSKDILRKKIRRQLSQLAVEIVQEKSAKISKQLEAFLVENKNQIIGTFAPIQAEPLWFISLDENDFNWAYPRIVDSESMVFTGCRRHELVMEKAFGIEIPTPPGVDSVNPEVLLVPGLAFDENKNRLGRGRGFYDRYLENFKGTSIGLFFEDQLVDKVAVDEFDKKLDVIITDKKIRI